MMEWDPSDVVTRLRRLADDQGSWVVFGAPAHGFEMGPPMPAEQLARFEQEHRITFPPSFATFLTQVGNGGAGPGYGLFRLGEDDPDLGPWGYHLVGDPSKPFPHSEGWKVPDEGEENDDEGADQGDDEGDYFAMDLIDGSIPLNHMGCATHTYLVITGPLAGQVWTDDRANSAGIYPCEPTDFVDWYLTWLDSAERQVGVVS